MDVEKQQAAENSNPEETEAATTDDERVRTRSDNPQPTEINLLHFINPPTRSWNCKPRRRASNSSRRMVLMEVTPTPRSKSWNRPLKRPFPE